jgi:GR25 family glycosyltransferase involved in LPS biosynthesis
MVREKNQKQRLLKVQNNKLKNFPKVYCISLEESIDRRNKLEKQFAEYNISPIITISNRGIDPKDEINGPCVWQLDEGTKGCLISHIKMIKKWYEESNDEWGFFCEDDLSLETVKYWDFTWEEFTLKIPQNAMAVQMLIVSPNPFSNFDIKMREWQEYAVTAYILKREYAKRLIEKYCKSENVFDIEILDPRDSKQYYPMPENAIFEYIGISDGVLSYGKDVTYSVPLFIEDISSETTFPQIESTGEFRQKDFHIESYLSVLNYWKTKRSKNER